MTTLPASGELYTVITTHDIIKLRQILQENPDVIKRDVDMAALSYSKTFSETTYLHIAIQHDNYQAVRLLLQGGADLHKRDEYYFSSTPSELAISCGNYDMIRYILFKKGFAYDMREKKEYNSYVGPMYAASREERIIDLKLLYILGVDINTNNNGGRYKTHFEQILSQSMIPRMGGSGFLNPNPDQFVKLYLDLNIPTNDIVQQWLIKIRQYRTYPSLYILPMLGMHITISDEAKLAKKQETIEKIKADFSIKFMEHVHDDIVDMCLAMYPLNLPPYIMLWIIDWLPSYELVSHHRKIHLIESIRNSIWKVKGITIE